MANKYTRKGQDAPPVEDEFVSLSARAFQWLVPHANNVAMGAAALSVVIAAVWIFNIVRTGSREDATEMFGRAVRIYDADLLPEDAAKDKDAAKAEPPAQLKGDDEVTRYKTAKERGEATLAELDKLAKAHGSSAVSDEAQAFRAGVLYDLGRFDEARAADKKFAAEAGKTDPVRVLARESEGLILEQQGKLDEAMGIYKELEDKGGDFFRERARYDLARVMVKKGDTKGAQELYKKMLETTKTGLLHDEIQNRLTSLGG